MVQIFLNGYGNIGRRLATAFSKDKSIELTGIAKYSPDEETERALNKGYNVFVPKHLKEIFQKKDFKMLETIGHQIKGNALSFGFDSLAPIAASLEEHARQKDATQIEADINSFASCLEQLKT